MTTKVFTKFVTLSQSTKVDYEYLQGFVLASEFPAPTLEREIGWHIDLYRIPLLQQLRELQSLLGSSSVDSPPRETAILVRMELDFDFSQEKPLNYSVFDMIGTSSEGGDDGQGV